MLDRLREKKFFEFIFMDCERNIFHYLDGEDSTFLVWNLRVQLVFRQFHITDKVVKISLR
jgi:hypothetical protein